MKAIILARVSDPSQKEAGNSLPGQLFRLERYAQQSNLEMMNPIGLIIHLCRQRVRWTDREWQFRKELLESRAKGQAHSPTRITPLPTREDKDRNERALKQVRQNLSEKFHWGG